MTDEATKTEPVADWPREASEDPLHRFVRRGVAFVAIVALLAAVAVVFVSLINVVEIWFDYQYVPIARAFLAGLIALAAVAVLMRLARK